MRCEWNTFILALRGGCGVVEKAKILQLLKMEIQFFLVISGCCLWLKLKFDVVMAMIEDMDLIWFSSVAQMGALP
jgi:hypothetical protein